MPIVMLLVAMLAACFAIPQQATAEDFYAGKTVTILVGFSAGGGFDINARALARHIGRHIPGTPNVVVDNMPGASSVTSILYLDNKAPQDGTFIDTFNFGLLSASLLRPNLATLICANMPGSAALARILPPAMCGPILGRRRSPS